MSATVLDTEVMESLSKPGEPGVRLHLLVVEPEASVRSACCEIAETAGFLVESARNLHQARTSIGERNFDVALIDLPAGSSEGPDLIGDLRLLYPRMVIIAMTTRDSINTAVAAMRRGASDYLSKPFTVTDLSSVLQRASSNLEFDAATRHLREQLSASEGLGAIIGRSTRMEKIYRILSKVALSSHPVLILGESGTGKEMVARTIHAYGPNARKPFLPVDCGSLVPTLIESELFGYVKGAFTGAVHAKDGLLVSAEGGTVFLDEVGELSLDLQAKLLRTLQEREVRPVGATHRVPIKARVLAATNRDLSAMVEQGTFRKDLFYRLNVVNLRLPTLRERKEDIPLLAAHFLNKVSRERNTRFILDDAALRTIMEYDWPGNVRELENAIERACTMTSGPILALGDLPTQLQTLGVKARPSPGDQVTEASITNKVTTLAELEKQTILKTIRDLKGDKLLAAKLLGIGKTTLYRKLKEYGVADPMLCG